MVTPNPQFNIQIDTQGLEQAIQSARKIRSPAFIGTVMNDGLRQIGRTLVPSKGTGPMANETPKVTGKLARSTFFEIRTFGGLAKEQSLVIRQPATTPPEYGNKFYGEFVREGTRAHEIRARLKKALRWETPEGVFFATRVNHPGTRPNPYHLRVINRFQGTIRAIIGRMSRRITGEFGRRI